MVSYDFFFISGPFIACYDVWILRNGEGKTVTYSCLYKRQLYLSWMCISLAFKSHLLTLTFLVFVGLTLHYTRTIKLSHFYRGSFNQLKHIDCTIDMNKQNDLIYSNTQNSLKSLFVCLTHLYQNALNI